MHFLYKKKILLNGHICTFHNLNCMYDYYLVADRYKNDIFTLNLLPTQEIIICTIPSHIHAWINANGMRYLYIWRSTNVSLYMYHIIRTKGNTIFYFCFQAHAYFEVDSKTIMRLKSWKMKTTPHEIRATVYNEKIDVCFNSM